MWAQQTWFTFLSLSLSLFPSWLTIFRNLYINVYSIFWYSSTGTAQCVVCRAANRCAMSPIEWEHGTSGQWNFLIGRLHDDQIDAGQFDDNNKNRSKHKDRKMSGEKRKRSQKNCCANMEAHMQFVWGLLLFRLHEIYNLQLRRSGAINWSARNDSFLLCWGTGRAGWLAGCVILTQCRHAA